jgi:hypothetical protein
MGNHQRDKRRRHPPPRDNRLERCREQPELQQLRLRHSAREISVNLFRVQIVRSEFRIAKTGTPRPGLFLPMSKFCT